MNYRAITPGEYEAVRQFLHAMGWDQRVRDAERFRKMIERADRTVVVWEGERVIGCARALCDGVSNGYISLLAVAPDKQGQGIGREMVRRLMADDADGQVTWVLRAGHARRGFWEKVGFTPSEVAMERLRH